MIPCGPESGSAEPRVQVVDLGRMSYADAYEEQNRRVADALALRESGGASPGVLLLVEHDPPVITVTRRPGAMQHLLADDATLLRRGVTVADTDRGGDITYHGPGQLVVYPIIDLNWYGLRLHDYMRLLEEVVIGVCGQFGVRAGREPGATGVWVASDDAQAGSATKICALGVRVRRWVSMHGLALNVTTDLSHFDLIVPCGLAGRRVTSLRQELGSACPDIALVKQAMIGHFQRQLTDRRRAVSASNSAGGPTPA